MKSLRATQPRPARHLAEAPRAARAARSGFTLAEALVTVTVVGLLAAISVSRIGAIESHQRVSRATNSLQNTVQVAFTLAVRDGHPVRLAWSADSVRFNITNRGGDTTYRHVDLGTDPFNLTASDVSVSTTQLEIYPNGLASDTLLVTVSADGVRKSMRVSRAGLVAIQ